MGGHEEKLVARLKGADAAERRAAAEEILGIATYEGADNRAERDISFAVPALAECLADSDPGVTGTALRALAAAQRAKNDGVSGAIPAVVRLLLRPAGADLREPAARILRQAINDGLEPRELLPDLGSLIGSEEDLVRSVAALGLARGRAARQEWDAVRALMTHPDRLVRRETAAALAILNGDALRPLLADLRRMLEEPDEETARAAAATLALRANAGEALAAAFAFLLAHPARDKSFPVLAAAVERSVRCRGGLPREEWQVLEPAIAVFATCLAAGEDKLMMHAARALTGYFSHTGKWDECGTLLASCPVPARVRMLEALRACDAVSCRVDFSPVLPSLLKLYCDSPDEVVGSAALTRLRGLIFKNQRIAEQVFRELHACACARKEPLLKSIKDCLGDAKMQELQAPKGATPSSNSIYY